MKITAVIPCYNEAASILDVVTQASKYVNEVIVSDDCSSDDTQQIAQETRSCTVVVNKSIRGAGANTLNGLTVAMSTTPNIIVTLDGDGQHNPHEIPKLLTPIINNQADIVIGARPFNMQMPKYRRLGNYVIRYAYNVGSKYKVADAQSCFRAFNIKSLQLLDIKETGFSFSTEVLIKARAANLVIAEVPIQCIYNSTSQNDSTLKPLIQGLSVCVDTLLWRLRLELLPSINNLVFNTFRKLTAPLIGKNFGRIWPFGLIYKILANSLLPTQRKQVVVNGCAMSVLTQKGRDLDGISRQLLFEKSYEPLITKVMYQIIKPGMKVIDVGANIGYYTLLAAKLVGSSGRVYAFEPESYNFQALKHNVELNNFTNVSLFHYAVGNVDGIQKLYVSSSETGEHSLVIKRHCKFVIEVPVVAFDSVFPTEHIDIIKVDTEGNDINVIRGALQLITRSTAVTLVIEFWPEGIRASGSTTLQLWNLLQTLKFNDITIIDEQQKLIIPAHSLEEVEQCYLKHHFSVNLVCSRK